MHVDQEQDGEIYCEDRTQEMLLTREIKTVSYTHLLMEGKTQSSTLRPSYVGQEGATLFHLTSLVVVVVEMCIRDRLYPVTW